MIGCGWMEMVLSNTFICWMIQAVSGFVALRDMVRYTQSQFHLQQYNWAVKSLPRLETPGTTFISPRDTCHFV